MQVSIVAKKIKVSDKIRDRINEKLEGLSKFFKDEVRAKVNIYKQNKMTKIEATLTTGSLIIRTENAHVDEIAAVDDMDDLLRKRIIKNKTKLKKGLNKSIKDMEIPTVAADIEEEIKYNIIKKKKFELKPMSPGEAILQMNLLGHSFFLYENSKSGKTEVVYKRKDGDYACIES